MQPPPPAACCLLALAILFPAVGLVTILVPEPQIEARGNPLYWAILLPPALWISRIIDYTPGAMRSIRPGLFLAPFLSGAVMILAHLTGGSMTQYWVMLSLTIAATAIGGVAYDRSLLKREGPDGA